MNYVVLTLSAVVAGILFWERARRIFWVWLVLMTSLGVRDYWRIEDGKAKVRDEIAALHSRWRLMNLNSAEAKASYQAAKNLAVTMPLHWWEGQTDRTFAEQWVLNEWLVATQRRLGKMRRPKSKREGQ